MPKQNPLSQGLSRLSQPDAAPTAPARAEAPIAAPAAATPSRRAPSRTGQTLVGGFYSPEVHKQLRILAAETGETQQALLADALNMLFAKHGKPEIATLGRITRAGKN